MVAFFCSTPYQILLAINIKSTILKSGIADIYVLNHFKDADNMVKKLKSIGIFNKVEIVNCIDFTNSFSRSKIVRLNQKIKMYIGYKNIVKIYFEFGDTSYDEIYLTYPDVVIQLATKELSDRNPEIKIHMYEDGTGGYDSDIRATSIYKKLFNKLTGYGKTIDQYDSIMFFKPELYSGNTLVPKVCIPYIDKNNNELKSIINKVFGYENVDKIDEKIVFFEQPMNHVLGLNDKIKEIIDQVLTDDYIIKLHPRSNTEDYDGHNTYQNNGTPWEIHSLNSEIEEKVLISYYSTASISNKIIFDKEPILIFLYDMEELTALYQFPQDTKKFLNKFKNTYRNPSKIFTPKNLNELKQYLNVINLNDNFL